MGGDASLLIVNFILSRIDELAGSEMQDDTDWGKREGPRLPFT